MTTARTRWRTACCALAAGGAVALMAGPASASTPAGAAVHLGPACRGALPVLLPAAGPDNDGVYWTAGAVGGFCVGTVEGTVVGYEAGETITWRVVVFTPADSGGQTIAERTVPASAAPVDLTIRRVVYNLTDLCLVATGEPAGPVTTCAAP
jgi:hypothetical protein